MVTFGCFWFFFSIFTYGSAVPSGVFLSAILVGLSVGQIYENIRSEIGIKIAAVHTPLPLILGAACMMSSYTRLSYSIIVLMLECSDSFNLAVPMIIAVFTSHCVSECFTNSIFEREIRAE